MTKTNNNEGNKKLGVYIHIPFCVKKCAYCDFLSFECEDSDEHKVYVKALVNDIGKKATALNNKNGNYIVDSIFIGGGTPSILLPGMINDIIHAVKYNFNVDVNSEITIEANPGTLNGQKLKAYLDSGINRLSIGAQSFSGAMLSLLGRIHHASDISRCYNLARDYGFRNINLDLMFAIPRQTIEMWEDTLDKSLALSPEHISFYSLQIEECTKFYEMFGGGGVSGDLDREMYHLAIKKLAGAGYNHYEISNAAKPGYECRHNIKYWSMEDYLGLGPGAHSFIGGKRIFDEKEHENSLNDDISEYMFTGLRMMKGISLSDFEMRFKKSVNEIYSKEWPAIERYIKDGFLIVDSGSMRLSGKGIDISNKIMSEFILLAR